MDKDDHPYEEGKRAGAHPAFVLFGVILGLWLLITVFIPNPKRDKQGTVPENPEALPRTSDEADAAPIIFSVGATVPEMNAIAVIVPSQATASQIVGLLKKLREARIGNTLNALNIPATTPGHKLGSHAVADIYIFSDRRYATAETISVLSRGAHAPGALYPQAVPFETAMEQVRGHYRIDLNDTGNPDRGTLGFADESGVHSQHYRRLFGN